MKLLLEPNEKSSDYLRSDSPNHILENIEKILGENIYNGDSTLLKKEKYYNSNYDLECDELNFKMQNRKNSSCSEEMKNFVKCDEIFNSDEEIDEVHTKNKTLANDEFSYEKENKKNIRIFNDMINNNNEYEIGKNYKFNTISQDSNNKLNLRMLLNDDIYDRSPLHDISKSKLELDKVSEHCLSENSENENHIGVNKTNHLNPNKNNILTINEQNKDSFNTISNISYKFSNPSNVKEYYPKTKLYLNDKSVVQNDLFSQATSTSRRSSNVNFQEDQNTPTKTNNYISYNKKSNINGQFYNQLSSNNIKPNMLNFGGNLNNSNKNSMIGMIQNASNLSNNNIMNTIDNHYPNANHKYNNSGSTHYSSNQINSNHLIPFQNKMNTINYNSVNLTLNNKNTINTHVSNSSAQFNQGSFVHSMNQPYGSTNEYDMYDNMKNSKSKIPTEESMQSLNSYNAPFNLNSIQSPSNLNHQLFGKNLLNSQFSNISNNSNMKVSSSFSHNMTPINLNFFGQSSMNNMNNICNLNNVNMNNIFGSLNKAIIKPTFITSSSNAPAENYEIMLESIATGLEKRATLMLKNVPNKYTLENVLNELDELGFKNKYNFFYLPPDLDVSFL